MTLSRSKRRIFNLASIALGIYLSESLIPKPFPWLRLGLANILVLIGLLKYGFKGGFSVAITKVVAGSIMTGKIFTPFFFFTLTGTLTSLLVMYLAMMLPFSMVGISVAGSVSHNIVQIILATIFFIPAASMKFLYPLFTILAVGSGIITGVIGSRTIKLVEDEKN